MYVFVHIIIALSFFGSTFIYCVTIKRNTITKMRHFTLSSVTPDKPLNYDIVDMPPFDGDWADRRYTHETIPGEPQTSLNARPKNIPRNAELMTPAVGHRHRYRHHRRHHRRRRARVKQDTIGSFPWTALKTRGRRGWRHLRRMTDPRRHTDTLIQLLLLINIAIIIYLFLIMKK